MTRIAGPRVSAYAGLAALGLVAALALGRPELVALAAPFALAAVVGAGLPRDPKLEATLSVDRERALEGEEVVLTIELAAAAGADPIAFRRKYLDPNDKRGLEVIERLAALAKWESRPSPQKQISGNIVRGRGMSYVKYELARTYVGAVAEVEVDRGSGEIKVAKIFVTHDCGQIINPDGLRNQLDGNILQTVSRVLKEEVKFDRSRVTSLDWESYPILRFPEMPEIAVELIDRPTAAPWGAGEPSASVIPSAISNAVFDATGVRLRSIPYTPAKVKAALGAA